MTGEPRDQIPAASRAKECAAPSAAAALAAPCRLPRRLLIGHRSCERQRSEFSGRQVRGGVAEREIEMNFAGGNIHFERAKLERE